MKTEQEIIEDLAVATSLWNKISNKDSRTMLSGYMNALMWVLYGTGNESAVISSLKQTDWDSWRNSHENKEKNNESK